MIGMNLLLLSGPGVVDLSLADEVSRVAADSAR
jgi:hypothetical protein